MHHPGQITKYEGRKWAPQRLDRVWWERLLAAVSWKSLGHPVPGKGVRVLSTCSGATLPLRGAARPLSLQRSRGWTLQDQRQRHEGRGRRKLGRELR